eukprot:6206623-Pleurochrysis_carterae.AAC.2
MSTPAVALAAGTHSRHFVNTVRRARVGAYMLLRLWTDPATDSTSARCDAAKAGSSHPHVEMRSRTCVGMRSSACARPVRKCTRGALHDCTRAGSDGNAAPPCGCTATRGESDACTGHAHYFVRASARSHSRTCVTPSGRQATGVCTCESAFLRVSVEATYVAAAEPRVDTQRWATSSLTLAPGAVFELPMAVSDARSLLVAAAAAFC